MWTTSSIRTYNRDVCDLTIPHGVRWAQADSRASIRRIWGTFGTMRRALQVHARFTAVQLCPEPRIRVGELMVPLDTATLRGTCSRWAMAVRKRRRRC